MKDTIAILRKRHEREIKDYQDGCKHAKSEWMPYMWAPGHMGPDVLVCLRCDKILEREKEKDARRLLDEDGEGVLCGQDGGCSGCGCP